VQAPDPQARFGMAKAAHLAGKAINISKTTASHALSYKLTTDYGVPHGQAVALTIGPLLTYNAGVQSHDCLDPRGSEHVKRAVADVAAALGCSSLAAASERIAELLKYLECPQRLSEIGARTGEARKSIAASCNAERMSNNPRRLTQQALEELLASIA
jgi:alcohol dehydrogenase class IV